MLQKAKFLIYGEKGTKVEKKMECMFNPSQYAIKNSVLYKEETSLGSDVTRMTFSSGAPKELTLDLFFDSMGEVGSMVLPSALVPVEPVTKQTQVITKAIHIAGNVHHPPLVAFVWGNLTFKGVITSLTETYTMFDASGKPIRAKLNITIKEAREEGMTRRTEPFESPDRTKYRTVVEGMSLWSIAYEEYDDCEKWRVIAKANGIAHPLRLFPGQVLKIPAL